MLGSGTRHVALNHIMISAHPSLADLVPPYDPSSSSDQLTPEASYNAGAPIHGVWLQRSAESSSKIMTAINVEQWVSEADDGLEHCELNLFTLQLSPVKYGSSFTLEAILDLPDFYLWLLEGESIVFVDGFMDIRVWNWKIGLWGYIKDDSNMPIDGPVSSICVLGIFNTKNFFSEVASQT